ncbi:hypothetical protein [Acinetobacter sp. ANC 4178]|uniref:hypothetical protein n=1 Tax=Acinetobacter sp. ANC 4178 TaxID=2529839 RepID=UPI00103DF503|nr:hypothetical protein [Acinetobacter sp. ANC 4178]TCB69074.1 hypothetical protein E0H87_03910 [Acinetobacter sp. ANC 4178]
MAVAADIGSFGGWGTVSETAGTVVKTGTRANPIGAILIGVLTPSTLGDGTISGMHNININVAEEDIEDSRSSISQEQKDRALASSKAKTKELEKSCSSNNKECNKGQHSGRIQAQNGYRMIVTATEAGSAWTNQPVPPPLLLCKQYALSMRIAMLKIEGHSKPDQKIKNPNDYHKGATKAYKALIKWMEQKVPYGVTVGKHSFSFDGTHRIGEVRPPLDCRRIDLDVMKGEILKS